MALALMAGLSSCAAWDYVLEGEDQELIIKTDPPLADCTLYRGGVPIAHLYPTPGAVYIQKTKHDITVTCTKPGYQMASAVNASGANAGVFVHMVLPPLGPLWWPVDSMMGADNKYHPNTMVILPKQEEPPE